MEERQKTPISKYLGIKHVDDGSGTWSGRGWEARIQHDGEEIFLGKFDSEIEASVAYNSYHTKHRLGKDVPYHLRARRKTTLVKYKRK